MPTIKARILKAGRVLKVYRENHPDYHNHPEESDQQAMSDMLSDCLHFCESKGWDIPSMLLNIRNNWESERKGGPEHFLQKEE
jgi:hypothetical protein